MSDSIISRFNPDTIFEYVCEEDRKNDTPTIFLLKGLTVIEKSICDEFTSGSSIKLGNFVFTVLKLGLVGWKNFHWEGSSEEIPFNFSNFNAIPYQSQSEISKEIIRLSEVSEELEEELIFASRWSEFLRNSSKADQWNCEACIKNKLPNSRNCNGDQPNFCHTCKKETFDEICEICGNKTAPRFKMRIGNPPFHITVTRCPVSMLSVRAIKLINLINYMENSHSLPVSKGALEQSNFFYNIRMIVLSEQNNMLKNEMDKK